MVVSFQSAKNLIVPKMKLSLIFKFIFQKTDIPPPTPTLAKFRNGFYFKTELPPANIYDLIPSMPCLVKVEFKKN